MVPAGRSPCLHKRPTVFRSEPPMATFALQSRRIAGLLLAIVVVTGASRAVADPLFSAAFLSFDTGTSPLSLAIGDVNGDGKPDLVTANLDASTVSVLLGTGGGGFGAKADFATGGRPTSVAIGDVNGDGEPDLMTANYNANTVSVLLGNGTGSIAAKTDFAAGASPSSFAIGDLN